MRPLLEDVMGPDSKAFLDFAAIEYPPIDISTWALLFAERHGVMRDWAAFFDTWDVLLTPTWTQPPFPHGADIGSLDDARNTLSLMRPGAARPTSSASRRQSCRPVVAGGLPVGAQLTGPRFADLDHARRRPGRRGPARRPHPDRSRHGVTNRLVALDLPGGPGFVDALRAGVGRRRRRAPRRPPSACPGESSAVGGDDAGAHPQRGRLDRPRRRPTPSKPGDALVVPTSGSTGDVEGRRPDPQRPRRLGSLRPTPASA